MKKAMRFWIAFFLALGTMISFNPRSNKIREATGDEQFGIAHHFENVWSYLSSAVDNHG